MNDKIKTPFSGSAVNSYHEGAQRQVPGYNDLHRMMSLLLAENTPKDGTVLILGAGGGQEIKALADAHKGWSFDGIDPSADMLSLAKTITGQHAQRVRLFEGYINDAPQQLYDAATCILVFHFIPREQRLETLTQIRRRLKTGAPFIAAHLSFSQNEPERSQWIARHVAFGLENGTDPLNAENTRQAIGSRLSILSPQEDVALMQQAGFSNVSLFYAGLSIRGWVGYAA